MTRVRPTCEEHVGGTVRGTFYPADLPTSGWLPAYARRFTTVELNSTFYRLPQTAAFEQWAAAVPADFVFAVKASRYVTHIRRLREPEAPVALLLERSAGLGSRRGPVLVQLPPDMQAAPDALDRLLRAFPAEVRVAVEFRHRSWFAPEVRVVLEPHQAALCLADVAGAHDPLWPTAPWGYVRLHRGRARPQPCYGDRALRAWAERIAGLWPADAPVYVYFNNDTEACAPVNALRLRTLAAAVGLDAPAPASAREAAVLRP